MKALARLCLRRTALRRPKVISSPHRHSRISRPDHCNNRWYSVYSSTSTPPATARTEQDALEELRVLVSDRNTELKLPVELMQRSLEILRGDSSRFPRCVAVLSGIAPRLYSTDRFELLPELFNETSRAADKHKDERTTDQLWNAFRDKLPGRAIDEAVYGIRIRYLFKEKQPKRAISLALDMCRRWEDKPQRLTEQLDLILLRLVAVPALTEHTTDIVALYSEFKVPKSVATFTALIGMQKSYDGVLKHEESLKTEVRGKRVSTELVCALLRAATKSNRMEELERIKAVYFPRLEAEMKGDKPALEAALRDANASFESGRKKLQQSSK